MPEKQQQKAVRRKKETRNFYFLHCAYGKESCFDLSWSSCSCLSHFGGTKPVAQRGSGDAASLPGLPGVQGLWWMRGWGFRGAPLHPGWALGGPCCPWDLLISGSTCMLRSWEGFEDIVPTYPLLLSFSLALDSPIDFRLRSLNLGKVISLKWHLRSAEELPGDGPCWMSLQCENCVCLKIFSSN